MEILKRDLPKRPLLKIRQIRMSVILKSWTKALQCKNVACRIGLWQTSTFLIIDQSAVSICDLSKSRFCPPLTEP